MSDIPPSSRPQKRPMVTRSKVFRFDTNKDVKLLKSSIAHNPFQLGKQRWEEVAKELKERFKYEVTCRTVRERVELLVAKFRKEELVIRTGTEEDKSRKGELLGEVVALIEAEEATINNHLGAEDSVGNEQNGEQDKENRATSKVDKVIADLEREEALKRNYPDAPASANSARRKRLKSTSEDDLVEKKLLHDMKMEERRMSLEEETKKMERMNEEKRLDLDVLREKRLSEEAKERSVVFASLQETLQVAVEILQRK